ncbi:hypothetical protein [Agaribacterium sp. ZY112]|uniref:hypothetical protein n=1 Tax=Agaribacterium sp. ZY112 TaxID=3233574 RepID=UPI003523560B
MPFTENNADQLLLSTLGTSNYALVNKACSELSLRPYQYGYLLYWYQAEFQQLLNYLQDLVANKSLTILKVASKLRGDTRQSIYNSIEAFKDDNKLAAFSQNLAMYISLRQGGPLLDIEGLNKHIADKQLAEGFIWDKKKWQDIQTKEALAPSDPNTPKLDWHYSSWANGPFSSIYDPASQAIVKHLGLKSIEQAKFYLLSETPGIGLMTDFYQVHALVGLLFQEAKLRRHSFEHNLKHIAKTLTEAHAELNDDIKKLHKHSDWSRYGPLVRFVAGSFNQHAPPSTLIDAVVNNLIPKPKAGLSDHIGFFCTVASVALAFFPPTALASASFGIASSVITIGSKITEYNKVVKENKTRKQLIASSSGALGALVLIEDPSSTQDIEMAILIEAVFGSFSVVDAVKAVKELNKLKTLSESVSNARAGVKAKRKDIKYLEASSEEAKKGIANKSEALEKGTELIKKKSQKLIQEAEDLEATAEIAVDLQRELGKEVPASYNRKLKQFEIDNLIHRKDSEAPDEMYSDYLERRRTRKSDSKKAIESQNGISDALAAKASTLSRKDATLKKQVILEEASISHSNYIKARRQKQAIDKKLRGPKPLSAKERRKLINQRDKLDHDIIIRKSMEKTRKATGVSAKRLGKEIENNALDLAVTEKLINKSNKRIEVLHKQIEEITEEIREYQSSLSKVAFESSHKAKGLRKIAGNIDNQIPINEESVQQLKKISDMNVTDIPKAEMNKQTRAFMKKTISELHKTQELIKNERKTLSKLINKQKNLNHLMSESVKKLDVTSGGQAVLMELSKRGILVGAAGAEFAPEAPRYSGTGARQ